MVKLTSWAGAAAVLLAVVAPAISQTTTGTISPPSPPPWSGEAGASGDPTMTAEAIRESAANFHQCLNSLWPLAAKRRISRATYVAATKDLTPDLRIMDLLDSQPEFTKSFWDYLDILVTDERITQGRELLAKYGKTFDAVEKTYGVDRYILAAIWGVETKYGAIAGERPVLRSTATLAC